MNEFFEQYHWKTFPYDTTHRPPNPRADQALEKLRQVTGANWQITERSWKTGGVAALQATAEDIRIGRTVMPGTSHRRQAEYFIRTYGGIFFPAERGLDLLYLYERGPSQYFQQHWQGLPVYRATFDVSFFDDGIRSVHADLYLLPRIDVEPSLSKEEVVEVLKQSDEYTNLNPQVNSSYKLVIYPSNPPRLMWSLQVGRRYLLVDAHKGHILDVTPPIID